MVELNPQTPELSDADKAFEQMDTSADGLSIVDQVLANSFAEQQKYFSETKAALNSTTLLTALATSPPKGSALLSQNLESARQLLESGQELDVRYKLAQERAKNEMGSINRIAAQLGSGVDPELYAGFQASYEKVRGWDMERKKNTIIEMEAIDRIKQLATTDPIQSKVLSDNLWYGNADQVTAERAIKLAVLKQRAEELDHEYQQEGWGKYLLNMALNLVPLNYNFAHSGIMEDATVGDFFAVGSAAREESDMFRRAFSEMTPEEFADFASSNGPLMSAIRDNATTVFDLTYDPSTAISLFEDIQAMTPSDTAWGNAWGAVEIASVAPWKAIAGGASRFLTSNGARREAVKNLHNALEIMRKEGPEAMTSQTGMTVKEVEKELSVAAVTGDTSQVSLGLQVADREVAARKAIDELFNAPDSPMFFSVEEAEAALESLTKELQTRFGSPLKDVHIENVELGAGLRQPRVTFLVGKKDGAGYASAGAARRAARNMGLGDAAIEAGKRTGMAPLEGKLTQLSKVSAGEGETAYRFTYVNKAGDESAISLHVSADGVGKVDIQGLGQNLNGAREMRAVAAQLADEVPELKTLTGPRVTGARAKSGGGIEEPVVNIEGLRGQLATYKDESGQYYIRVQRDMNPADYLVTDLAPEAKGFVGKMLSRFYSPAARNSDARLHGMGIQAGSVHNRLMAHVDNDVMEVFRQLPKESRDLISTLGKVQTIDETWLTEEEIHALTQRHLGRRATDAEVKAMADLRLFNDMDYELRNAVAYVEGVAQGKESVKFQTRWGEEIDEDVIVDYNLETLPSERVYDVSANRHYSAGKNALNSEILAAKRNKGYVMLKLPEAITLPEGITVNRLLIKKSDIEISPLRRTQLPYTAGGHRMYVPKNGGVFIKQGRKGVQSDTGSEFLLAPNTYRVADNIAEGRAWAKTMNEARLRLKEHPETTAQELEDEIFRNNTGSFPTGQEFLDGVTDGFYNLDHPFEAVFDREMPEMYAKSGEDVSKLFNEDELGINGYYRTTGRMYTSAKGEILRDTKGQIAEILDPYTALSRSLAQVTKSAGLFGYKTNALNRFQNTYKRWLDIDPAKSSPSRVLLEANVIRDAPPEIKNAIEGQRNAILNVLRFETPGERLANQLYQSIAERALGDGTSKARELAHDAVWWWKERNPVRALRGLAFDAKLGMFNPAQFIIQSSTMLSATALSPKYGMYGMRGLVGLHAYILKGGSENMLDHLVKRGFAKSMGFASDDEFKEFARHAYTNGFMEMNGSHLMINNHGPTAYFGSFAEKQERAREMGRFMFYAAETNNRLVAYRIAWGETWDKGLRPVHPDFTANVLKLADDYSFNMTQESAAQWQKGVFSIPTQFWAYNARMFEAIMGKRFTGAQRARLAAMQVGMAGSAGLPIVAAISEYIKNQTGHAPPIDSIQGALDRGLIDYLNYKATGTDILLGERVATGGWATDTIKTIFGQSEYGAQSFDDIVGGATWTISKSMSKTLYNFAKYASAEAGDQQVFGEITKEQFVNVFKEISTFGNLSKALVLKQTGMLKANSGTIQASNLPSDNAIYQALSFRPAKAEEMSYLMQYKKNHDEVVKDFTTKLRNWRQEAVVTGEYEKYWVKANVLINMIPYADRREILRSVNRTTDQSFYDHVERKVSEEQLDHDTTEEE